MEITNKTLGLLLVAAVTISLFGTIISINRMNRIMEMSSLSGYATTAQGNVSVYVNTSTSIRFAIDYVDWGTGYVNTTGGYVNCTLRTDGTPNSAGCVGFNELNQGFVLENDGTTTATVQLYSNANASQFIGGTSDGGGPQFMYKVSQNESNSCISGLTPTSFTDVNTTSPGTTICPSSNFNFTDSADSIKIDLYVNIPYTVPPGQKLAVLTATAS
ncbi:MAG: hypothetical protein KatS3mg002_1506 [Candidatus Woesearchaeota archaeon]|nr:MAG: hypothetical protein KatS3mg002_1506 [Candidatus Woesearchaeota archaeon]